VPYALLDSWSTCGVRCLVHGSCGGRGRVDQGQGLELTGCHEQLGKTTGAGPLRPGCELHHVHIDAARDGGLRPFPPPKSCAGTTGTARTRPPDAGTGFEPWIRDLRGRRPDRHTAAGRGLVPFTWQFNHCITAIKVDDSAQGPAVIEHPDLGRLVIFDGTDAYTRSGASRRPRGRPAADREGGRNRPGRAAEALPKSDVDV
jgi:hypothetical protein